MSRRASAQPTQAESEVLNVLWWSVVLPVEDARPGGSALAGTPQTINTIRKRKQGEK